MCLIGKDGQNMTISKYNNSWNRLKIIYSSSMFYYSLARQHGIAWVFLTYRHYDQLALQYMSLIQKNLFEIVPISEHSMHLDQWKDKDYGQIHVCMQPWFSPTYIHGVTVITEVIKSDINFPLYHPHYSAQLTTEK